MTFIQPNKNRSFWNGVLVVFAVAVVAGTVGMVALYNMTVNLGHNIASVKSEMDAVGARSTDLNNKIMDTLGGVGITRLAAENGLVMESKPQYFTMNQKWPIASHY